MLLALMMAAAITMACGSGDRSVGTQPPPRESSPAASDSPSPAASTPSPDRPEETAAAISVVVRNGAVTGVDGVEEIPLGEEVQITVRSDVDDQVHVHGYDEQVRVKAGKPAVLSFSADIPGVFEVELEDAGLTLFELRVQ